MVRVTHGYRPVSELDPCVRSFRRPAVATVLTLLLTTACTAAPPRPASPEASPPALASTSSARPSPFQEPAKMRASEEPTHTPPAFTRELVDAVWTRVIDAAVIGLEVSVAVGVGDRIVYSHEGFVARVPASNQKLLTSMAALDAFGPAYRIPTAAEAATDPRDGVLHGNLWLVGAGDPELTDLRLAELASKLRTTGLREITGSVVGDTSTFTREWWAPGWIPGLSRHYVTRPTALAIDGNHVSGAPERWAAASLTSALEMAGVNVAGEPNSGAAPNGLRTIALVRSDPLREIIARQNHGSVNFDAEMLTKALGLGAHGRPGSTASGADAIEEWAAGLGVHVQVRDGSGLSHQNRVSAVELVTLLLQAQREPWGTVLLSSLPAPGTGTLADRLAGVPVRAKTGTLIVNPASALSGYVRSADGVRVAFSVISRGLDKTASATIEDAVVRALAGARID